ncbi:hypothetical protein [Halostagnicola sp. A-GB9-2]|uniref:hypothetical protein n=1 Tax=Halostagnicola sp. A-GB9-2 TaxID=3048066 RepID=UPI0024C054E6|nr:hypothetical protein [Halostagnicola sp. A-GB9-2]MDJ1431652.1 hypothetical protein [Halostagnicola sp. A-GB9-2]
MNDADRPLPPEGLDEDVLASLAVFEAEEPSTLRAVATYLEERAAWEESRDVNRSNVELPEGVPERATVSVTEIAGTEYHYYQWREGDEIKSTTRTRT